MEKITAFFKSPQGKPLFLLILVTIAFWGGMEYKAYQIRKAVGEVFGGISEAFGGLGGGGSARAEKETSSSNNLNAKVSLEVVEKSFSTARFEEANTFTLKLANTTDKDIEGVKGEVTFLDIFGDEIKSVNLSYDEGIPRGESVLYKASIDFNQFMNEDAKLRQTPLEKLKVKFEVEGIVYKDGTAESN